MARIRSVKPEFWTSEQVMHMSRDARLLFIGLWNFCDDNGIHPASALTLKAQVFPADPLTADQVMSLIDEMIEQRLIEEYEASGRAFWRVTGWRRHQRIDSPTFRHPTGDVGDATCDVGDTGDTGVTQGDGAARVTYKKLGGKQRQIVLRKLRERDGDVCHLCPNTSGLTILSIALNGEENANEINNLRLVCSTCKRAQGSGGAKVFRGDVKGDSRVTVGDLPPERKGEERKGELNPTTTDVVVAASDADDVASPPVAKPTCPHQEIIALYHEILPMCPEIRDWTPARAQQLRARWNENAKHQDLDYWRRYFTYVATCDFLVGRRATHGRRPFFASLEWLTKAENFAKVREQRYEERNA